MDIGIIATTERFDMSRHKQPPLSEPALIDCVYVTGMGIEIADNVVRFVGWNHLPVLASEHEERRIVVRFAMSVAQVRNLMSVLRRGMERGH
ncbi:MAG: hypothetical protein J0H10_15935 [Alphaproteobacteria bacterium]|nr:hypothetical protein [Alphaproteobacteria bacterium]